MMTCLIRNEIQTPTMKKKYIVIMMFQAQIKKKIDLAMMNLLEILGIKIKLSFKTG